MAFIFCYQSFREYFTFTASFVKLSVTTSLSFQLQLMLKDQFMGRKTETETYELTVQSLVTPQNFLFSRRLRVGERADPVLT